MASKRTDILDQSKVLFWKHGIRRVSIEEICEKAGCSKMTFYRNFTNKAELVASLIEGLWIEGHQKFKAIMSQSVPFRAKLQQAVKLEGELATDMSQEFVDDILNGDDEELVAKVLELKTKSQDFMREIWREAQEKGELRASLNLDFVIAFSDRVSNMGADPEMRKLFGSTQEYIKALSDILLFGIESRDN